MWKLSEDEDCLFILACVSLGVLGGVEGGGGGGVAAVTYLGGLPGEEMGGGGEVARGGAGAGAGGGGEGRVLCDGRPELVTGKKEENDSGLVEVVDWTKLLLLSLLVLLKSLGKLLMRVKGNL